MAVIQRIDDLATKVTGEFDVVVVHTIYSTPHVSYNVSNINGYCFGEPLTYGEAIELATEVAALDGYTI